MDTFSYLSNAHQKGYNISNSWGALISEFEKGNISYPRTDNSNHMGLIMINPQYIMPQVKELLEKTAYYKITDEYIEGDFFMLAHILRLSTPASIVSDYEKASKVKEYNIQGSDTKILFTMVNRHQKRKKEKDKLIEIELLQKARREFLEQSNHNQVMQNISIKEEIAQINI